jgi:hypothetical protein
MDEVRGGSAWGAGTYAGGDKPPLLQDLYNSAISDKHYKREGAPGTVEHYSRQKTSLEVQLKAGYLHVGSLTMSQVQEIRHFLLGR